LFGRKDKREEYNRQLKLFEQAEEYENNNKKIKIKYLANHYYLPIIISDEEKIDYISHIIDVPSEIKFIKDLEKNVDKIDKLFDWWMFSKIDETLDEVFIPYYSANENKISKFKPDFIFWAQKGNNYLILFVDPKGTEHTDGYRKIDGYSRIFEIKKEDKQKQNRYFLYNGLNINVKLLFMSKEGKGKVLEEYRDYWFDNFNDFIEILEKCLKMP
jgi:hypothetical protein